MALAVLDRVAVESHEEEDVRRRDLVREKRSAMERKCDEGRGDILGAWRGNVGGCMWFGIGDRGDRIVMARR